MNENKKTTLTTIGFLLAGVGFLALVLSLVGVKLSYLVWLDRMGPLFGFVAKLIMVIAGIVLIYVGKTDLQQEEV